MEKVYLIHGWGGGPKSESWFPWLRRELEKKGFSVEIPEMPNPDYPKIGLWIKKLEQVVKPDKNTCLIGHSIGCQTILRYLEKLPKNAKIGGAVFVAGWFDLLESAYEKEEEKEIAKLWIKTPINFEKIKQHTSNFLAIFSDDDPCVPLSDSKLFKEKLNAKIVVKHNEEHFNETKEIKEIIDYVIKMEGENLIQKK